MSCLSPVLIALDKGTEKERFVQVRCRECEDCKQSLRSSAVVRMHYEDIKCQKAGGMIFFFTLTFADEYVPFKFHRMCFDKKLIQEWLQKFRQMMRRQFGYRVKYFIVSELGHVGTHRPHHHGKLYLYPDNTYQLKQWREGGKRHCEIPWFPVSYASIIRHAWTFGRADVSVFDPTRGGNDYVSKYISKDVEEENLFKDILTRIKMKRGKGNPDMAAKYYGSTFPSLFAFTQRYCAFTMISKGVGDLYDPSFDDLVQSKPVNLDGFDYACPRYYSDRYIRAEQKANMESLSVKTIPQYKFKIQRLNAHTSIDTPQFVMPSERVFYKYIKSSRSDLFNTSVDFVDVPLYTRRFTYEGKPHIVKVLPKQSECSTLSRERKRFLESIDKIEELYFSLPSILQASCNYDVPQLLMDVPKLNEGEFYQFTYEGAAMVQELKELSRVASEWRAKARITNRENQRKLKLQMNTPYARKPLTWEEYKSKSIYLKKFAK